jgi:hypothetical protein
MASTETITTAHGKIVNTFYRKPFLENSVDENDEI